MSAPCEIIAKQAAGAPLNLFERYLTVWVALCIVLGIALGQGWPQLFQAIGAMEVAKVNLPVGLLIWVMIIPMLVKIDFGALHQVRQHGKGIAVTLFVNWAVKPFSMALLGWLFVRHWFAPYLPSAQIDSYIAGLILLAAAPCTAMVFVWSRLTNGDPYFTLSQVAINDLIMVFAFAPLVGLLLGVSSIAVPWATLLTSVVLYIVLPVIIAQMLRRALLAKGAAAFDAALHKIQPWSVSALLADAGAAVRVPGRCDPAAAAGDCAAGGADPDPGVLQCGTRLLAQQAGRRTACGGRPVGADRRVQLLRAGGGGRDQPVRFRVRRRAGHRGRGADRSAGDAAGGEGGECEQALV